MRLRAMRHSTIQVVRHQGRRLARVAPLATAVGRVSAAHLPAVLRDPSTALAVPASTLRPRDGPAPHTDREQDDGKPPL